jgi:flagellar biosynthetic protein FliP
MLVVIGVAPVAAQAFPDGATQPQTGITIPSIDLQIRAPETNQEVAFSIQLLLLLTILSLAPSILILVTCFLRFSIVLDFIKRALSLQQVPPTMVLNGIAFFMTLFIMWPVLNNIYTNSFRPLADGEIGLEQAYNAAETPLKEFMFRQMENGRGEIPMDGTGNYIGMFLAMGGLDQPSGPNDVPIYVVIPAYILHELTIAFQIGILLYIPFIVIDMVVASVLMSMGMIMLPPVQISMPFKLMLFVLIDGWGLLTQQLFNSIVR